MSDLPQFRFHQSIHRWGNSLAVLLPADCLRRAGLKEGDPLNVVITAEGHLRLEPLPRYDRKTIAEQLRQRQIRMQVTPSVIELCRDDARW